MMDSLRLLILLLSFDFAKAIIPQKPANENAKQQQQTFEGDDLQHCTSQKQSSKIVGFEALPGVGWDNLRNKNVGQVVHHSYSLCRTTDDGRYFIPDGVNAIPAKTSESEMFAELFEHWNNYTSTLSASINIGESIQCNQYEIEGKFSYEFERVKSKQVWDESSTIRAQLRYVRYVANLQPDTALKDTFRSRLLKIAYFLQMNQTDYARYESQLVVRDYGTHVITSVDTGAALVQLDQVKTSYVNSHKLNKSKILEAVGGSFWNVYAVGIRLKYRPSKEFVDEYANYRTDSDVKTYGGAAFKPQNFSLNDWVDGLEDNLVAVDVSGDPIHYMITPTMFPELPTSVVYQLAETVKKAVHLYYEYNTYRGCTKADSPNFSFQANVDDGTCESTANNYTLGGIYQTCKQTGLYERNLCQDLEQRNPLTDQFSCPEGYEEILVDSGSKRTSELEHKCVRCYMVFDCCNDNYVSGTADYQAFWCAAKGPVKQDSGYLFGGVFTSITGNVITGSRSCPLYYYPLKMSTDLNVCVSDDYELGYQYSIPFGGFFSCKSGNPLKLSSDSAKRKQKITKSSLGAYVKSSGANRWPRGCPRGFSQRLAFVDKTCEINYCIRPHAITGRGLPKIRRPPFIPLSTTEYRDTESYEISQNGLKWSRLKAEPREDNDTPTKARKDDSAESDSELSDGEVAAISVFSTFAFAGLAALTVSKFRNKKTRDSSEYQKLTNDQTADYGIQNGSQEMEVEVQQ